MCAAACPCVCGLSATMFPAGREGSAGRGWFFSWAGWGSEYGQKTRGMIQLGILCSRKGVFRLRERGELGREGEHGGRGVSCFPALRNPRQIVLAASCRRLDGGNQRGNRENWTRDVSLRGPDEGNRPPHVRRRPWDGRNRGGDVSGRQKDVGNRTGDVSGRQVPRVQCPIFGVQCTLRAVPGAIRAVHA